MKILKNIIVFLAFLGINDLYLSQNGSQVFDDTFLHEIYIESDEITDYETLVASLHQLYQQNRQSQIDSLNAGSNLNLVERQYLLANITIDGVKMDSVGIRFKGNGTYHVNDAKNSFKIDFNEFVSGKKYDDLKKINLHNNYFDASMLRQKIVSEVLLSEDLTQIRTAFVKVYLNEKYLGVYTIVEQIDKTFLQHHFDNKNGYLYKVPNVTYAPPPFIGKHALDADTSQLEQRFILKTHEESNNYEPVKHLLKILNETPDIGFKDSLEKHLNVNAFIKNTIVDVLVEGIDNYYRVAANYYLYENTSTQQWEFLSYDYDLTFNSIESFGNDLIHNFNFEDKIPLKRILENESLRIQYLEKLCDILQNTWDTTLLFDKIDQYYFLLKEAVYEDAFKPYSNEEFDEQYVGDSQLKTFIKQRRQSAIEGLKRAGFNCILGEGNDEKKWTIYPNPSSDFLYVENNERAINEKLKISLIDLLGKQFFSQDTQKGFVEIDLSSLSKGLYFLIIEDETGKKETFKLLKE